MINFDNAATTFPKPATVRYAAANATERYGNAGRGGHALSQSGSEMIYSVRETIGGMFGAEPENTVLTLNCTHSLNMAIKGIMHGGGHLLISSMEHNASARPAAAMAAEGRISLSVFDVSPDMQQTTENLRAALRSNTRAVVCTLASNVTGLVLPWREIGDICAKRGICFIADGAQTCGIKEIRLSDGINILCSSGHKGLYGLTGTGFLLSDGAFPIHPVIEGGTGTNSSSLSQPELLPESLESGTLNIIGAATLKAGAEFVKSRGIDNILAHEDRICRRFISELSQDSRITIYRPSGADCVPVVSFNISGIPPERAAGYLSDRGYCLRAGLHCAPLAHRTIGTLGSGVPVTGTIRFSPSVFSREEDAVRLARVIRGMKPGGDK
ncbi:MAG: aminotransferase class V-fold PLP-dependent enzyme [Ruminococcus sp.]|nr:aminotransferase class V-fold PLP-dependent enzyme [Ruminococcus sp.]